jgi:hypothetical protein
MVLVSPDSCSGTPDNYSQGMAAQSTNPLRLIMNEADLAWVAGFFDGEGCVMVRKYNAPKRSQYPQYQVLVNVAQKNPAVLYWIADNFGGSVSVSGQTAHWQASSVIACNFLRQILPYLKIKGPQAVLALEFQATITSIGGVPLTPEVYAYRNEVCQRMKDMKRESYGERPV